MPKEDVCEYYSQHKGSDPIGDNHVFLYDFGELLMCDNYNCRYGNNSGGKLPIEGDNSERFLIEGEMPLVGVCLSKGLKKIVESEEAESLSSGSESKSNEQIV